jgi:single-strand DNA-binding protein
VTSFSLATNRVWKDKSGAKQESVDYHNIVLFARLAELANQYLKKGSSVFIEGRMQTRSWDDPTGKKYRTEIVADTMQFGPRASGTGTGGGYTPSSSAKSSAPQSQPEVLETIEYPQEDINPDDIPF